MLNTSKNIYLDIHQSTIPIIYAKQYDNVGRNIVFKFLDRKVDKDVEPEVIEPEEPIDDNKISLSLATIRNTNNDIYYDRNSDNYMNDNMTISGDYLEYNNEILTENIDYIVSYENANIPSCTWEHEYGVKIGRSDAPIQAKKIYTGIGKYKDSIYKKYTISLYRSHLQFQNIQYTKTNSTITSFTVNFEDMSNTTNNTIYKKNYIDHNQIDGIRVRVFLKSDTSLSDGERNNPLFVGYMTNTPSFTFTDVNLSTNVEYRIYYNSFITVDGYNYVDIENTGFDYTFT